MISAYASRPLGPVAENASASSYNEALTDEQISMLDGRFDEFKAAGYRRQEQIVEDILGSFESTWARDFEFNEKFVAAVRVPFSRRAWSHTFLAYSPVHVRKKKASGKERPSSRDPGSDPQRSGSPEPDSSSFRSTGSDSSPF